MGDKKVTRFVCREEDICNPAYGGPLPSLPVEQRPKRSPAEHAAIDAMGRGYDALGRLGWSDIIYCPKDGSHFLAITAGSRGVFECNYIGDWPNGSWWIYDGDMWPAYPILWKPLPDQARSSDGDDG